MGDFKKKGARQCGTATERKRLSGQSPKTRVFPANGRHAQK